MAGWAFAVGDGGAPGSSPGTVCWTVAMSHYRPVALGAHEGLWISAQTGM